MECGYFAQLLSAQLDGQLTAREALELEDHLPRCPACRALAAQLAAMHDSFETLEEVPAPAGFAQGVMERIRDQEMQEKKTIPLSRRPRFRALVGLAACLALCVGVYQTGLLDRGENAVAYETAVSTDGGGEPDGRMVEDSELAASAPMPSAFSVEAQGAGLESQSGAGDGKEPCQVGGQTVAAVLTLSRLPQEAEGVLGPDVEWLADEEGRTFCLVSAEQMEAVCDLAEAREDVTASLAGGPAEGDTLCALVIVEES